MRIFKAEVADIPRILPCSRQYTQKIKDLPLDEKHWIACWENFIGNGSGVIYLAEDESGFILGGIGGIKYPCMLTGRMMAVELFWYTDEKNRGMGIRLYSKFEQWAKESGCQRLAMIYLPDSMPEKLHRFYEHKGFFLREMHFEKELV